MREAAVARPPLRFSCPCCGLFLEVPAGMAGVRGPCPGCRREIQAPPGARPRAIEIKPRRFRRRTPPPPAGESEPASDSVPVPAMGAPPPAGTPLEPSLPVPPEAGNSARTVEGNSPPGQPSVSGPAPQRQKQRRAGRAVSPFTGVSELYHDRRETIMIIKIVVAVAVTLAIVLTVRALVTKNFYSPSYEQRPEPSEGP